MDTVVVVFERPSSVSLKSLSEQARTLLFPLRIFPVQMENGRIIKRWALTKSDKEYEFVEKEERCEVLKSFVEQLRTSACIVLVDMQSDLQKKWYFCINTQESALTVYMNTIELDRYKVENTISGIIEASNIFFKKITISLIGIRIRNKSGKKESVDIPIGVDKIEYPIPTEMTMIQHQPTGILIHSGPAALGSGFLMKILSKNELFFSAYKPGVFLKLYLVHERPFADIFRLPEAITLLDSSLPFMKKYHLQEYLQYVIKKYGEDIRALSTIFSEKPEKRDLESSLSEEIKRIRVIQLDRRNRLLQGINDLLSTLSFKESDPRHIILATLSVVYNDIVKRQKIEGVDGPMYIHLPPSKIAPPSSLHSLLKEIEM
ncbi:hypothetical protein NEIRO03_2279 [Nematocida sp. AWRm78]|nr:hypothetical protein NEIRO02_1827 [Nematocida sp. AWRm79]KAI5167897.1 hypothetical protein NEIRO02_2241 [Nematocida sp. AWRm79]KAI5184676.1 hypothetical protein NEIRO03_1804 [Nematocida sp. AWRm78]KAI5186408.1 hypothetical protein NEIRO03_2279 [Nematocida sp. AWRm78]